MSEMMPIGSTVPALRPERPADADFRAILHVDANADVFASLPDNLRELILRQQLAAQGSGYRTAFPGARYDIVEADGAPIGRIVTETTALDIRVVDIALLTAWRRRGIGTTLLRRVIEDADAAGVPVRLEVATTNADALRLYERLGFRCVARSDVSLSLEWRAP